MGREPSPAAGCGLGFSLPKTQLSSSGALIGEGRHTFALGPHKYRQECLEGGVWGGFWVLLNPSEVLGLVTLSRFLRR